MSTPLLLLSILPASIAFNFFYWRNLREDYTSSKIFTSGILIITSTILSLIIFGLFSQYFANSAIFSNTGLWFWGAVVGYLVGVLISSIRFRFKLNEVFDSSIGAMLVFLVILLIPQAVAAGAIFLLILVFFIVLLVLYYLAKSNYKRLTVYKSGKIGLASLLVAELFFIIRAIIAIFFDSHMLSLIGKIDGLISAIFVFILFLSLYNLSQTK